MASPARASHPALPHLAWLTAGALVLVSLSAPLAAQLDPHQVKAAFLLNFVRFVSWPETAAPPGAPIVIAVLGADDLAQALEREAAGQVVGGRSVRVRIVRSPDEVGPALHLLFIGGSERENLSALLRQLEGRPVLTVGDAHGFGAAGVVLNFYVSDTRIRFEANTGAAARAGLTISSHLLRIARIVG